MAHDEAAVGIQRVDSLNLTDQAGLVSPDVGTVILSGPKLYLFDGAWKLITSA